MEAKGEIELKNRKEKETKKQIAEETFVCIINDGKWFFFQIGKEIIRIGFVKLISRISVSQKFPEFLSIELITVSSLKM